MARKVFSPPRSVTRCFTAALASLLTFGSGAVLAQDATIHVNGAIASGSCRIFIPPVNLGNHLASKFTVPNTPTSWVDVDITSEGCDTDIVTLYMQFNGDVDQTNNNLFAVSGGATGLGIELQTIDGRAVIPNSATNLISWSPLPAGGVYAMHARYLSTLPKVTVGAANSTVTVMLSYN